MIQDVSLFLETEEKLFMVSDGNSKTPSSCLTRKQYVSDAILMDCIVIVDLLFSMNWQFQ